MHIDIVNEADEITELHSFCREMILTSYRPAYCDEVVRQFIAYHSLEHVASDAASGCVWAAREGGRLVGTVTVAQGELSRMFVSPAARGRGLGARLAGMALGYARDLGVRKLTAWSVPFSRGFYEKLGFRMLNADTLNFSDTRDPPVPVLEMALWPQGRPEFMIVPAEYSDIEEMLSGQREAFREQCELYDDWGIPPMTETPEDVARFMSAGGVVLKALEGGRIIGAARGMIEDAGICHVGRLWVMPRRQGAGAGRMLVAAVEEACAGCRLFSIFTGERSERNLALYEKQGYAHTGKRAPARAPGTGSSYDLVWLEKPNPWPQIAECARRFSST